MRKTIQPIIVVRPSGVWNSRSPLNDYVNIIREIHRTNSLTSISAQFLEDTLQNETNKDKNFKNIISNTSVNDKQRRYKYVNMYNRSFGTKRDEEPHEQSIRRVIIDRYIVEIGALRLATVMINGAIENYIQCWFLNYCLSRIECGLDLTKYEIKTIEQFNPAKSKRPPNLGSLMHNYPFLRDRLKKIPPYRKHPKTRKEIFEADCPERSAFRELEFWQNYRNLIIHSNGITSPSFFREFSPYHNYKRTLSRRIPKLVEFAPLPIDENLFSTQAACFYRIAFMLRDDLLKTSSVSEGRNKYYLRGHRHAPGPTREFEGDSMSPPMLMDGDHDLSVRWTREAAFRQRISKERGWGYLRVE